MKISIPDDCGNSPRMAIVSQFSVDWASGDAAAVREWLVDDATWSIIGQTRDDSGDSSEGLVVPHPPIEADAVAITTTINHGRVAACEGQLHSASGRIDFCHVFRFKGATKTAKITEIRSYLIPN